MNIKEIISKQINIDGLTQKDIQKMLLIPPQKEMGDLSLPCFSLAKTLHKNPNDIAKSLKDQFEKNKYIKSVSVLNGYLNFELNAEVFNEIILGEIKDNLENFGKKNLGKNKLALVEYSSINVAKNPHVGHLCGTAYGESFCRLFENFGYTTKRLNYLGDYGTQFGKVITAYQKYGSKEDVLKRGVDALQELYIRINKECEDSEDLLNECRECFLKLEKGDKEIKALYDWFVKISIDEAKSIYEKLGVVFDDWKGEAYYAKFNKQTLDFLKEKNLVQKSQGALIVDLEPYNLGKAIVEQSSGASIYATRDLSCLVERYKEYHYDKLLYVTGVEQEVYFQQIFQIGRLMGLDYMDRVEHFSTGRISLPTGKISSRKGAVALIKDLFEASINQAKKVLEEKGTNSKDIEKLSEDIGIGALIFTILKSSSTKDTIFDLEKAISFDGETGPYLQYTYARTCSILEKAKEFGFDGAIDYKILPSACFSITKLLSQFEEILEKSFLEHDPSYIARFAINLSSDFNRLYNEQRIISDDKNLTKSLVNLTKIVNVVLKKCLYFLVMQAPEKM